MPPGASQERIAEAASYLQRSSPVGRSRCIRRALTASDALSGVPAMAAIRYTTESLPHDCACRVRHVDVPRHDPIGMRSFAVGAVAAAADAAVVLPPRGAPQGIRHARTAEVEGAVPLATSAVARPCAVSPSASARSGRVIITPTGHQEGKIIIVPFALGELGAAAHSRPPAARGEEKFAGEPS